LDDDYFKMLTAEKATIKFHKGFKKRVYVKIRPRNESLDCMVYSIAAYAIIGVNVNTLSEKNDKVERTIDPKPNKNPIQRPRKGGFVSNWR
jgi:phage terminase large subunit GpA-like protein